MKRKIEELLKLMEMARVGAFVTKNGHFDVRIYEEPLGNPSFHLINHTKRYEVVLQIKDLRILEWKKKPTYMKSLPVAHLRDLIEWLSESVKSNTKNTNWEFLRDTWVANNPKYPIPHEMPDYKV